MTRHAITTALLAVLLTGCRTNIPPETYAITITITAMDRHDITPLFRERGGDTKYPWVDGFYSYKTKTAYVPWTGEMDIHGKPLPCFKTLGHEVWHAVRGNYHR
jgi:hypothetical protein